MERGLRVPGVWNPLLPGPGAVAPTDARPRPLEQGVFDLHYPAERLRPSPYVVRGAHEHRPAHALFEGYLLQLFDAPRVAGKPSCVRQARNGDDPGRQVRCEARAHDEGAPRPTHFLDARHGHRGEVLLRPGVDVLVAQGVVELPVHGEADGLATFPEMGSDKLWGIAGQRGPEVRLGQVCPALGLVTRCLRSEQPLSLLGPGQDDLVAHRSCLPSITPPSHQRPMASRLSGEAMSMM